MAAGGAAGVEAPVGAATKEAAAPAAPTKDAPSLSHVLEYPLFGVEWVRHRMVLVAGGGGASRTGVPNGVAVYRFPDGAGSSLARLEKHRERLTGDELPYFIKALPTVGILAVALGPRLELWRIDDLKPLVVVPLSLAAEADDAGAGAAAPRDPALVAAFSDDGGHLAVGAQDGRVRVFRLKVRNPGSEVEVEVDRRAPPLVSKLAVKGGSSTTPFRALAFHPNGFHLLGACDDGTWKVWAMTPAFGLEEEAAVAATLGSTPSSSAGDSPPPAFTCRCARFSPEGDALFTVHYLRNAAGKTAGRQHADRRAWLTKWKVAEEVDKRLSLLPVKAVPLTGLEAVTALDLSDDGAVGVVGDREGRTLAFATDDSLAPRRALQPRAHSFAVTGVALAPTGGVAAGAGQQGGGGGGGSGEYLVASCSGDRTLRLHRLRPPRGVVGDLSPWQLALCCLLLLLTLAWVATGANGAAHDFLYALPWSGRQGAAEGQGEGWVLRLVNWLLPNENIH